MSGVCKLDPHSPQYLACTDPLRAPHWVQNLWYDATGTGVAISDATTGVSGTGTLSTCSMVTLIWTSCPNDIACSTCEANEAGTTGGTDALLGPSGRGEYGPTLLGVLLLD